MALQQRIRDMTFAQATAAAAAGRDLPIAGIAIPSGGLPRSIASEGSGTPTMAPS